MRRLRGAALCACIALCNTPVAAERQDHPLLSRYAGSTIVDLTVAEYDRYALVTGRTTAGALQGEDVKGRITRLVYQNPDGRSTLDVYANYRDALARAGATMLYQCEVDACGPAYARSAWGRHNGLFAAADGDPRYLAVKLATEAGTAYVAVMVGKRRTQVDVVEQAALQQNLVAVDASALGKTLDSDGRVSVYGIYFDTDASVVKPESKPALERIAALLRARPALRMYVVGHTDMTGDLAHNRTLSEARARAVAAALVTDYGIARERLEGHGVGPLAPVASNATEAGRGKNRRVELVAR